MKIELELTEEQVDILGEMIMNCCDSGPVHGGEGWKSQELEEVCSIIEYAITSSRKPCEISPAIDIKITTVHLEDFCITKRFVKACTDRFIYESDDKDAPPDEWTKCKKK